MESVRGDGAYDALRGPGTMGGASRTVHRLEAIKSTTTIGQCQVPHAAHPARRLEPNPLLQFPVQHVRRNRAANDGRNICRPSRFKIHSPTPVGTCGNRWRNHSQRHVRDLRLGRQSNPRFLFKGQPVFGSCAQDIPLAVRIRFRRSDRCIEQPVASRRKAHDARRLQFGAVEVARTLQSRAVFLDPGFEQFQLRTPNGNSARPQPSE